MSISFKTLCEKLAIVAKTDDLFKTVEYETINLNSHTDEQLDKLIIQLNDIEYDGDRNSYKTTYNIDLIILINTTENAFDAIPVFELFDKSNSLLNAIITNEETRKLIEAKSIKFISNSLSNEQQKLRTISQGSLEGIDNCIIKMQYIAGTNFVNNVC